MSTAELGYYSLLGSPLTNPSFRSHHAADPPETPHRHPDLREDGCYYVDKTAFILCLIEQGKYYFPSGPRRFGKSLLLDTLAELFAGNQALFRGLYAHDRWDWDMRYPVIRISFGGGVVQDPDQLTRKIREQLRINQAALGVSCGEPDI